MSKFDPDKVPEGYEVDTDMFGFPFLRRKYTPYYLIDEAKLERNLRVLASVRKRAGVKILLAQKAFSCFATYPLVSKYLDGTTASGVYEARLAHEEMPGRENHVFNPSFSDEEFAAVSKWCDHVVLNTVAQVRRFATGVENVPALTRRGRRVHVGDESLQLQRKRPSIGLRVNPGYSEVETEIYNPCAKGSRLGVPREFLKAEDLVGVEGLHFHTMCEQGADVLVRTLRVFDEKFGEFLPQMKWVNFGGGHHITKPGYDVGLLVKALKDFRRRHPHLEVYLEPGEAVALNAGELVASVKDVIDYGTPIAVLDVSAECHMPDVIEMPYRPPVKGAGRPGEKAFTYRLTGPTCLAGDVIGDFSFARRLKRGSEVRFGDMAIYTMVKNNTFNGMPLPSIVLRKKSGRDVLLREFGYSDFKTRLGDICAGDASVSEHCATNREEGDSDARLEMQSKPPQGQMASRPFYCVPVPPC